MITTFKEYQEKAKTTAIYLNKVKETFPDLPQEVYKIIGIAYAGCGLGEAGEIQGKIKKIIRDSGGVITDEHRKAISKELGDLQWYIMCTCEEFNLSMEDVANENIEKLFSRQERGVLGGSGDNR